LHFFGLKAFLETEIIQVFRNRNMGETANHYEGDITKFYETFNRKPKPDYSRNRNC